MKSLGLDCQDSINVEFHSDLLFKAVEKKWSDKEGYTTIDRSV